MSQFRIEISLGANQHFLTILPGLQPIEMQQFQTSFQDRVQSLICVILEEILGTSLQPQEPFMEAGLDSLGAVELHSRLCASFNCELPATIAFDFPNAMALARYIADKLDLQGINPWEPTYHG